MLMNELNLEEMRSINGGDFGEAFDAFVGTVSAAGAVIAISSIPITGAAGVGTALILTGTAVKSLGNVFDKN